MNISHVPALSRNARRSIGSLLFLFGWAAAASAHAQTAPVTFTLDPATTSIHWTLNTTLHTVHGSFRLKAAAQTLQSGPVFQIDLATGDASGLIVIDAFSGESGDSARDRRMHAEVLESAKFPTIVFRPTHIDAAKGSKIDLAAGGPVTVHGILTLHGKDHPLDLTVNLRPGNRGLVLNTSFSVPFVAWGLKDPSTFIFRTEKQVSLDVESTATPTIGPAHVR
jgi:polyisoprenoid-binding protein YceI